MLALQVVYLDIIAKTSRNAAPGFVNFCLRRLFDGFFGGFLFLGLVLSAIAFGHTIRIHLQANLKMSVSVFCARTYCVARVATMGLVCALAIIALRLVLNANDLICKREKRKATLR